MLSDGLIRHLKYIPEPKDKWEATGWLSASIGDACYYLENYEEGISNLLTGLSYLWSGGC